MSDQIEKIGKSLIQHGPENDRIYLMHCANDESIASKIDSLLETHNYSKVFAKISAQAYPAFRARGYELEAYVPRFFHGKEDALFVSAFYSADRRKEDPSAVENLKIVFSKSPERRLHDLSVSIRLLTENDARAMTDVFRVVFQSYPFPIHDPSYLIDTMRSHIRYFGVYEGDTLVGISSAEYDESANCAEMTDFAVLPHARGKGYALNLLDAMEEQMREDSVPTLFTIARAQSVGMNLVFYRSGYQFSGMLRYNTNIAGDLESMNVWYKDLR